MKYVRMTLTTIWVTVILAACGLSQTVTVQPPPPTTNLPEVPTRTPPAPAPTPIPRPTIPVAEFHAETGPLTNLTWLALDAKLTPPDMERAEIDSIMLTSGIDIPACGYGGGAEIFVYSEGQLLWERSGRQKVVFAQLIPLLGTTTIIKPDRHLVLMRGNSYIQVEYFILVGETKTLADGTSFCEFFPGFDNLPDLDFPIVPGPNIEVERYSEGTLRLDIPPILEAKKQDLIAYIGVDENLWLIQTDGSNPVQVTSDGKPGSSIWTPVVGYSDIKWSPDGKRIAVIRRDETSSWLQVVDVSDLSVNPVLSNVGDSFDWLPDGNSIVYSEVPYQRNPADPAKPGGLSIIDLQSGEKRSLIESGSQLRFVSPDWAERGDYLYFSIQPAPFPDVIWGDSLGLAKLPGGEYVEVSNSAQCDWSPDGQRLVCRLGSGEIICSNLGIFSTSGVMQSTVVPTTECIQTIDPAWSQDGNWIAFSGDIGSQSGIFVIGVDGTALTHVSQNADGLSGPEWSPDNTRLLAIQNPFVSPNIIILDISTRNTVRLAGGREASWQPVYSPQTVDLDNQSPQPTATQSPSSAPRAYAFLRAD